MKTCVVVLNHGRPSAVELHLRKSVDLSAVKMGSHDLDIKASVICCSLASSTPIPKLKLSFGIRIHSYTAPELGENYAVFQILMDLLPTYRYRAIISTAQLLVPEPRQARMAASVSSFI